MEKESTREPERQDAENVRKKILSRDELLALSSELTSYLHDRTTRPSFRNAEVDRVRLSYARAAVAAISATASILKDQDLDQIRERLDALEDRKSCRCGP
jgi:hypothetical protein